MNIGAVVDNRALCEQFGVANMGGIRVNNQRSLIVLVSNNTNPTYRNEWRDGILHFVGRGSVGPQVLSHQNKTLANSANRGWTVHLFEVFEKSKYTYVGEVEIDGEPYLSCQPDARAADRFVWIFPLRKKQSTQFTQSPPPAAEANHLPYGAYAVIGADLTHAQRALVDDILDKLREAGVPVFDGRDVELRRYEKALVRWHDEVLDWVRRRVKDIIARRKRAAKAAGREFWMIDEELRVGRGSTETDLRAALSFLDYDEPRDQEQVFEEARQAVPMPDPPSFLKETSDGEIERPVQRGQKRAGFSNFT
jgi:hypothetical protein